jgi:hypothetical protein
MVKVQQKKEIASFYNKFYIDSFKISVDCSLFTKISIPENFTIIDSDSGEEISNFKRNSIALQYKHTTIYLVKFRRILNKMHFDKVMFLFSSKVADKDYLFGIKKHHVVEVIEFVKSKGYIQYENINELLKNAFLTDVDIKHDFCFSEKDRNNVKKYYKDMKNRFNGKNEEDCKIYDNKIKGLGLQTYHRDRSSISKPFFKYYDKTIELLKKEHEFYNSLPDQLQREISNNFIIRFEFTIKNKKFFDKFGLSNAFLDVAEVLYEKWREIARELIRINFEPKIKAKRNMDKLTPIEKILSLYMYRDIQEQNKRPQDIKEEYQRIQEDKKSRYRVGILFDRIYSKFTSQPENIRKISDYNEMITKFDRIFMFE